MIDRRDLLIGGACLVAAGVGFAVTPHRHVSLMGKKKFAQLIPANFKGWTSRDASDLAPPVEEGSEVARIYDELVERVYTDQQTGDQVMMLIAHGPQQTNELMLHRPEKCYPANGYLILQNKPIALPLAPRIDLPARKIVAESHNARENIIYWTRMGEYLPTSDFEQRNARLATVMHGAIADGVLARFSTISPQSDTALAMLARFIPQLLRAVDPTDRRTLIGTVRADAIASVYTTQA
jgi:EpsI family protein